ncbi:MAG TPA: tail fiber domain-containing protein [Parafilimonas sp.]|nr:tail fiber domain-containing protein [Parafilimonas sp.]
MKTILLSSCTVFLSFFIFSYDELTAQTGNWKLAGNNLAGTEKLGSRNNVDLKIVTNNVTRMTLKGNGKIGIGTANPAVLLDIRASNGAGNKDILHINHPGLFNSGDEAQITFTQAANPIGRISSYYQGNNTDWGLKFYTYSSNLNTNPAMTIQGNGSIGIGTNSPEGNLHIFRGSAGTVTANANSPLVIENGANNYISLLTPSGNEKGIIFGDNLNPADGGVLYDGSNNMRFQTNGNVTRMTLSGSGNLSFQGAGTGVLFNGGSYIIGETGTQILAHAEFNPDNDDNHSLGSSTNRWTDVWAIDGTINTSDLRDKTNVRDLDYGLKEIMQLRSIRFNWKNPVAEKKDKLGIAAQEIQKVLPEVVRDYDYIIDEKTGNTQKMPAAHLGVMYADIIPVLIKAIQEQQEKISSQDKKIEELTKLIQQQVLQPTISLGNGDATAASIKSVTLEQNIPNPFNKTTTIKYSLPQKFTTAHIVITDKNGKTLKQINISRSGGKETINVDAAALSAGAYNYSLVVNGRIISSRQMLLAR